MPSKADIRALKRIAESRDVGAALAAYLSRFKARKSPSAHAALKKQMRLGRKGAVAIVRPMVEARAKGQCECRCGRYFTEDPERTPEWDEFHGRKHVSIAETWMLARCCHRAKTQNWPTRAYWDERFKIHCERHGYEFRSRLLKGAVVAQPPKGISNG